MTSTLVNQNGSGKVGLAGPVSLSSSSEPFDVVNSLSEDLSNEHIEESVKSIMFKNQGTSGLPEVTDNIDGTQSCMCCVPSILLLDCYLLRQIAWKCI